LKNSKVLKIILFVLGMVLIAIGSWRLIMPVEFFASNGMELGNDVNILNEARAAGGMVLASGIIVMLGAFLPALTFTSTVVSILIFLSFGVARLIGIAIDGMPGEKIIQGIIIEFVFGLVGVFAFIKFRKK
jgi:hypothetical protein